MPSAGVPNKNRKMLVWRQGNYRGEKPAAAAGDRQLLEDLAGQPRTTGKSLFHMGLDQAFWESAPNGEWGDSRLFAGHTPPEFLYFLGR